MKYKIAFNIDFKRNPHRGKFIVIEGIDGSGKTIQTKRVVEVLKKKGYNVTAAKEPTDGAIGKIIKNDILPGKIKMPHIATQYLFSADRSVHQLEIEKELKKGKIVVMDRYFWSAVCYGIADLDQVPDYYVTVLSVLSYYNRFLSPDLTFFLDISLKTALKRIGKSSKHNEIYDNGPKLKKIKKAYDYIKKRFAAEFVVVDAEKSLEELTEDLVKRVERVVKSS